MRGKKIDVLSKTCVGSCRLGCEGRGWWPRGSSAAPQRSQEGTFCWLRVRDPSRGAALLRGIRPGCPQAGHVVLCASRCCLAVGSIPAALHVSTQRCCEVRQRLSFCSFSVEGMKRKHREVQTFPRWVLDAGPSRRGCAAQQALSSHQCEEDSRCCWLCLVPPQLIRTCRASCLRLPSPSCLTADELYGGV